MRCMLLNKTDALIVTELSRLGRSTAEVIALVNALVQRNIRLIAIKQNLDIQQQDMNSKVIVTLFSLFSELERDLISLRTKEALSAKRARGQVLGKPKAPLQAPVPGFGSAVGPYLTLLPAGNRGHRQWRIAPIKRG